MSYLTLEVEIDHGKVVAKEPLPEKGNGLLTIFQATLPKPAVLTPLQALEALQKHLHLDADKAAQWTATLKAARR
jgi:hypothetical protein